MTVPSLKTFAARTGTPVRERWAHVYDDVRRAHAETPDLLRSDGPADDVNLLELIRDTGRSFSAEQVAGALTESPLRRMQILLLDREYTALPLKVWERILEWSDVDRIDYVSEKRDCDNFAIALSGQVGLRLAVNGIGLVVDYSGGHAYNCILVREGNDLTLRIVEPQTDRMPAVGSCLSGHEAYKADYGFVMFA